MITAMFIFGSIGLFVRAAAVPSAALALIRGSVGTLFLLLTGIVLKRRVSFAAVKRNLGPLLFSGAAIGINWICLFEAYRYTTVAAATLCYYLAPVFVMLASPLLLKERLTFPRCVCILTALFGMYLTASGGAASGVDHARGIAFGLTAAVFYASVVLTNKFLKDIEAFDMTIVQLGTAAAVLFPYVCYRGEFAQIPLGAKTLFVLLFVGVVNTGVAYLLYFSSLQELDGQTAAIFSYIDPVTAILLSAVLLQEKLTAAQAAGAALILGATFWYGIIQGFHGSKDRL